MTTLTVYQPPALPSSAPCPHCGRHISINRVTSALRPHGSRNSCPGSRSAAYRLNSEDRESWRTGDVYALLDRYGLNAGCEFRAHHNMDPNDEPKLLINHNRRIILDAVAWARENGHGQ